MSIKKELIIYIILALLATGLIFYLGTRSVGADTGDFVQEGLDFGSIQGGTITGAVYLVDLTSNEVLSGKTTFGGWISGASAPARAMTSGVTATIGHSAGLGENIVFRNLDDTLYSGNSIFIVFAAGVSNTILTESGSTITSGSTTIQVSGTTLDQVVTLVGSAVSKWEVHSKQSLTLRNE